MDYGRFWQWMWYNNKKNTNVTGGARDSSHHSHWEIVVDDIVRYGVAWVWTVILLFWHLYLPSVHQHSTRSLNFLKHRHMCTDLPVKQTDVSKQHFTPYAVLIVQNDQKVCVHLMITIQKVTSNVNMSFLPDCLAAYCQGQGDTRLTLMPSVIPNYDYVIMVSDW
jgi:hypothetical protein